MSQPFDVQHQNDIKILGHRGAKGERPENTLSGFNYCSKITGMAGIEFDIQLTADNHLLIAHDDSFNRIANTQVRIEQITAKQAKHIFTVNHQYLPSFINPYQPNSLPSTLILLEELLPYLSNYQHIELEIKTHNRTNHKALIETLACCLTKQPFKDLPFVLTSFDKQLLYLLKHHKILAHYPRGILSEEKGNQLQLIQTAVQQCCYQIGLQEKLINQEVVTLCKRYNLQITAWTVNDFTRAKNLINMGVNTIITDYPSDLLTYLQK